MVLINITGLSTSDQLTFLILTGCTFWIFSYIILHFDVLILRKRLPKAPRTFKLPFGALIPVIGILGNAFMIYNIDSDWNVKKKIYTIFVIVLAILSAYAVIWIKCVMKRPMFKAYQIKEVMAMETDLYQIHHHPRLAGAAAYPCRTGSAERSSGCEHGYTTRNLIYKMKRPMCKAYPIKEVMAMETDLYQIHHHPRLAERLHIHAEPEVQSVPADVNTGTRPET